MSAFERAERVVRILSIVTVLLLLWVMQGGETLFAVKTPTASFFVHFLIFFLLTGAALIGWLRHTVPILLSLLAFALIAEAGQSFFPRRDFSMVDLIGNLAGVGLGALFFTVIRQFSRRVVV